jgi:hexosaminidase
VDFKVSSSNIFFRMTKKILKIAGVIVVILLAAGTFIYFKYLKPKPPAISAEDRAAITLMPLPSKLKLTNDKLLIKDFGVNAQGPQDDVVENSVSRFLKRVKEITSQSSEGKSGLTISYDSAILKVQPLVVNENYSIRITNSGIQLKAISGYGIIRGLETLLQLIQEENGQYYFPTLELEDSPRYFWRGLMIDVCRHWIPKEIILRNIEAMASMKMNVLHWHLSDYQGLRVESKLFPKLHELGSEGNYYSQQEIKDIVAFARDRGIRIVPEFDMPGHASSFLVGYPELASAPGPYKLETNYGIFTPVMDPTREEVYDFIDRFLGEMTTLFPDPFFHIGGDEVTYTDWEKSESIQRFMKEKNIQNSHDLQAYFNQRLEKILMKHNKRMVGWNEIINPNLSSNIVVQSWNSHKSLFEAVQKNNNAILSTGYYLDYKLPAANHYEVDPEILPGAVTIEPDSINWKQFDIEIKVSDNPIKSSLILYGKEENLRGLFYMMDNSTSFEKATLENNNLDFSFKSEFGTIKVEATTSGDSISGKMSLGLISFPFSGKRAGGSDIAGTKPPKVERIKPLTDSQKKKIFGGEAAIWTEVVSLDNIDSRIWPRTAAIAEKLWSPAELTKDASDMYRRLEEASAYLDKIGLKHIQGQKKLTADLTDGKENESVTILIDVLEEVKYVDRLAATGMKSIPLNEVVDASQPESMTARKFENWIAEFLADKTHQKNEKEIRLLLIKWKDNHSTFQMVANGNKRLEKVLLTSQELSAMSAQALKALDGLTGKISVKPEEKEEMQKIINQTAPSREGVLIAVTGALKKLVDSIR